MGNRCQCLSRTDLAIASQNVQAQKFGIGADWQKIQFTQIDSKQQQQIGDPSLLASKAQKVLLTNAENPPEQIDKIKVTQLLKTIQKNYQKIKSNLNRFHGKYKNQTSNDNSSFQSRNKMKIYQISQGIYYSGEFVDQTIRNGKGYQYWSNGMYYQGYWKNGKMQGNGFLLHQNLDYYDGKWKNGQAYGYGVYQHYQSVRYEGNWKSDLQNGYGQQYWPDGAFFKGTFKNGEKHKGVFSWPNGNKYQGYFKNNKMNGKGKFVWKDTRYYQGDWVDNLMDGQGVFYWKNGQKYTGQYRKDKKHGKGQLLLSDGTLVIGQYYQGKLHGQGLIMKNGQVRKTKWKMGKQIIQSSQSIIPQQNTNNSNINKENIQKLDKQGKSK